MSSKVSTATETSTCSNSNSSSSTISSTAASTAATNGSVTPVRRLRTRNSTSGNISGSDSAKKNGQHNEASSNSTSCGTTSSSYGNGNSVDDKPSSSAGNSTPQASNGSSKKYHNSCPQLSSSARKTYAPHTQPHSSSTFNISKNEEFHFDTPIECPVFRPTMEEFKNPLAYISKIRPIAEKCGIAKILPPGSWSPPFAVDVDKLKFTPRVQRLNELEAKTRVKLNFLDQIAKFWELQGASLKIPMVERKALDLYTLHRIVQEEGGMEQTSKDRKWAKVANRMSYPPSKSVGATLKAHYERILNPFEVYTSGKVLGGASTVAAVADPNVKLEDGTDYKAHEIPTRQQITPPNETNARRSKRFANSSANCGLGAQANRSGEKICTSNFKTETKEDFKRDLLSSFMATSSDPDADLLCKEKKKSSDLQFVDPLMKYVCHICNRGDVEESMLLCDGCDDSYHTFCLLPPLTTVPKGEWLCPRCVVEEVSKPTEAFGFEQAEREYTLQQFGQMADQFKMDYFCKPVHLVPTDMVEREFWRIVSSIDEDVTVEYGADLHTMDHGSGFPTKSSLYLLPGDQEYAESSWNLNNLPLLEDSILGHINADISGMNAPWMYVGMCFAAFCWHNEDHWSYSINYLHWGEPKTWYGVPGSCAEQFEETMKKAAPELFASQPDLLHQLVTIMNPNILMNNGVPVYRTDQNAGEFVITFPRAYHAGFNQGYNFAEAVNFAPADWLKMGRECVNHYSMLRRFCVFSHDELVCKMALEPAKLTFGIATACYIDMAEMVDSEKKLRKSLLEWGVTRAERKAFELVPDDERHCHECNTTCFLSAVSCECTKAIVCLRHYTVLCSCAPEKHTLLYRYTLDEMPLMLQKLKTKAQSFERWLSRCRDIVDASTPTSVTLSELQELCREAEVKKFPSSLLIDRLNAAVLEAEKCVTVIQQLGINKVRTRSDNNQDAAQYKLTMEELELFVQEIDNLCCIIDEGASVRELLTLGKQFVERASKVLKISLEIVEESDIDSVISEGSSLRIELRHLRSLEDRLRQLKWYKRAHGLCNGTSKLSYGDIKSLLEVASSDISPTDLTIDKEVRKLQDIGASIEAWEMEASKFFQKSEHEPHQGYELAQLESFLKTAADIEGQVPSYATLKDALRKAKEWLRSVDQFQTHNQYPYCYSLETVMHRGSQIPIHLAELKGMLRHLRRAADWKDNTAHAFLKKRTHLTLLEVLMPRQQPVCIDSETRIPLDLVKDIHPSQIVYYFKDLEEKEIRQMHEHRLANLSKSPSRDDFCLCKSPFDGLMYNCELCRDWFHDHCVPAPATNTEFSKWLCPSCVRSKRPTLESILPLLTQLLQLPVRLPEDEALRCLAERAMNWQERARKYLMYPDINAVLEAMKLATTQKKSVKKRKRGQTFSEASMNSVHMRKSRRSSQRNSKDSNDICNNSNPVAQHNNSDEDDDDDDIGRLHIVEDDNVNNSFDNHDEDSNDNSMNALDVSASSSTSAVSADIPKLLSESDIKTLEDLLVEGDLLEVSIEEEDPLYRIFHFVQPTLANKFQNYADAVELVDQYKKHHAHKQQLHHQLSIASNTNSGADDSNDSLLVQSSPNSNAGRDTALTPAINTNSGNRVAKQKRRTTLGSIDASTGCPVPRKKAATTPNPKQGSAKKQTGRKSDSSLTVKQDENKSENFASIKQSNGGNMTQSAQKKRKRASGGLTNSTVGSPNMVGHTVGTGIQKTGKNAQRAQMAQQEQDDEEECRADNCHKPTGREVDWVQCDGGCNEWFHMYCVGLNRSQIKADDDYICVRCSKTISVTEDGLTAITTLAVTASTTTTHIANNNGSGGLIVAHQHNIHNKINTSKRHIRHLHKCRLTTIRIVEPKRRVRRNFKNK